MSDEASQADTANGIAVTMPPPTAPVGEVEGDIAELEMGGKPRSGPALSRTSKQIKKAPPSRKWKTKSLYGMSPSFKFGPKASIMHNQATTMTIHDPGNQRLTWDKPPLSVLLIKKVFDNSVIQPYVDLVVWLIECKNMLVYVEAKVLEDELLVASNTFNAVKEKLCTFKEREDDLTDKIDFIICLGGDGTLLYASSLFQKNVPPVMAFHMGSLGFLTPWSFDDFTSQVTQVLEGNVALTLRTRLKCVVNPTGTQCAVIDNGPVCSIKHVESTHHLLVLNEVVVDRGPCPYLSNLDLYIEHKYVTSVQGDGLIISTATGSTAYAAAAGASMIHPSVPAILIAPICPHSLSFRPIVVPAGVEIKVMVAPDARNSAWASFDGRSRQEMVKGDVLRISTSIYPVPSICVDDQISDWFDSLSSCLNWNVRKRQKPLDHAPSTDSLASLNSNSNIIQSSICRENFWLYFITKHVRQW